MAHGRSLSWAIPVHAILSVEQTKKKEAPLGEKRERKTLHSSSWPSFFKLRARAQARHTPLCAAVWLGVCCVLLPSKGGGQSLAARLAQPNVFQKETLRLF